MDWQDLARTQFGAISRAQLIECGLTESATRGLIGRGQLTPILPGVYAPRSAPASFRQQAWASVLWSGGTLSHRSAARLWRLPVAATPLIHVTVPRPYQAPVAAVRLHRVPLTAAERTDIGGLPLTTCTRTLVDLLRVERYPAARDLLDRALMQQWIGLDTLVGALVTGRGRTGNSQLRRLLDGVEPGAQAESERVLQRLLRRARITGWVPQYRIRLANGSAYADLAFPEHRLVIEVDGRRHHDEFSDRFEADRHRQNELQARGWRVLRFTWRMLIDQPDTVAAKINELLSHPIRQDFAG